MSKVFAPTADEAARLKRAKAKLAEQEAIDRDLAILYPKAQPPAAPAPTPPTPPADTWAKKYASHLRTRDHSVNSVALKELLSVEGETFCTAEELSALKALEVKWGEVIAKMGQFSRTAISAEILRQATLTGEAALSADHVTFLNRETIEHSFSVAQKALRRHQKEIGWQAVTLWMPVLQRLEVIVRRFADRLHDEEVAQCKRFGLEFKPSPILEFAMKTGAHFFRDYTADFQPGGVAIQPQNLLLGIQTF